jgi:DNA-binding CsgD family transcriptional regulator
MGTSAYFMGSPPGGVQIRAAPIDDSRPPIGPMNLTLSSEELVRLEKALSILLSPLDYQTTDGWRSAACRAVKELMGVGKAIFLLTSERDRALFTEDVSDQALSEYTAYYYRLDEAAALMRNVTTYAESRVSICNRLNNGERRFLRSEIYHDWYHRHGMDDTVQMGFSEKPANYQTVFPAADALLGCYDDRLNANSCGERGLALVRLLLPAFTAGVRTCIRVSSLKTVLARTVDELVEGIMICERSGAIMHRNVALTRVLAEDPEGNRIQIEMEIVGRTLASLLAGPAKSHQSGIGAPLLREITTSRARYRIRGSMADDGLFGRGSAILVILEETTPQFPSEQVLQQRFGLTRKEARVALLMGEGKSTEAIARSMFISSHTARHHAEQVRLKLGVKSRAEIPLILLRR